MHFSHRSRTVKNITCKSVYAISLINRGNREKFARKCKLIQYPSIDKGQFHRSTVASCEVCK